MDAQTLARAMDNRVSMERYEELAPAFNRALIQAGCTSVLRVTMWCSQIGHESGGLLHMQEIASGSAYEGRADLGNTQPGDGKRFKGHGPIQITGRYNHTKVSEWAYSKGFVPTPTYFVDDPNTLAGDEFGFLGAVWYWTVARNMNAYADNRDLIGATRAVNGGQNGIDDRRKFYYRALALGDALLPQEDDMANAADVQTQLLGPDGKGWEQLGDHTAPRRSLVDGVARVIFQNNFAIAQNDRIEKKLDALLAANKIADPTVEK
ncbi:glycoside hydrolase family 19 protein [Rhodococcoides fascians]|uniref:glycoside hydrolase family 19 protein n=1 Tax=Rhodococcoides fascians TaxID=1828 RepID=UPI0027894238|nr:hypothetical protein [Rhodococcus fascians]MDQ0283750.1 putative chitinase [Rhodococcus fascians]